VIRHLMKLAWNRKGKNALLSVEVLIAFLVLIFVLVLGIASLTYVRLPLGYDYSDVLAADIRDDISGDDTFTEEQRQRTIAMMDAVRQVDGVVSVAGCLGAPLSNSMSTSVMEDATGKQLRFRIDEVTDAFKDTMDLNLVAGRWFGPDDDASTDEPVVVNRRLAEEALGSADVVGRYLMGDAPLAEGEARMRVIGVVDDYRANGELGLPGNFLFHRKRMDDPKQRPPNSLVVEFNPAAREGLEKRIEDAARAAAPGWGLNIRPLTGMRRDMLRQRQAPLIAAGLLGAFLLAMVAMGLAGVFWQSIAQRRSEMGLRRAAGATSSGVIRQIVGEVLAMVTLAVLAGLLLAAQVPLFGLSAWFGNGIYAAAVASAIVLIYLLGALAALAPALVASRMEPAEALRVE
jgi:putative ABC transport system permease protein